MIWAQYPIVLFDIKFFIVISAFVFRVLLRVRMMYYIKHEVIGDYSTQIDGGCHAR